MKKLCDFCTGRCLLPTLVRFRPFVQICRSGVIDADDGRWLACAACLELIEAKDVDGLVRRHMANASFSELEVLFQGAGEGSAIERASQHFKYMQGLMGMLLANRI